MRARPARTAVRRPTGREPIRWKLLTDLPMDDLAAGIRELRALADERGRHEPLDVNFVPFGTGMQQRALPDVDAFCEQIAARGFRVIRFDNRDIGLSQTFDSTGVPDMAALLVPVLARREHLAARSDPLRAVPPGIEPKLHLLARRLILPHPRHGVIDVTAPLPEHMKKSFAMFGFDESERDPIEDAPDA